MIDSGEFFNKKYAMSGMPVIYIFALKNEMSTLI